MKAGSTQSSASTLKMEAICSSESSVDFQRTTRRYIPEDSTLHIFISPQFPFISMQVHVFSDTIRIKYFLVGLKPFLHRFFSWLMFISASVGECWASTLKWVKISFQIPTYSPVAIMFPSHSTLCNLCS
jgi:hypothetical protein